MFWINDYVKLIENIIIYKTLLSLLSNENKIFRELFYNSHQYSIKSHGMFPINAQNLCTNSKTIFNFIYHILRALYLASEKIEFINWS